MASALLLARLRHDVEWVIRARMTHTSRHRLLLSGLLPLQNQLQTAKSRFQEIAGGST
jgi:hypothetical protein